MLDFLPEDADGFHADGFQVLTIQSQMEDSMVYSDHIRANGAKSKITKERVKISIFKVILKFDLNCILILFATALKYFKISRINRDLQFHRRYILNHHTLVSSNFM